MAGFLSIIWSALWVAILYLKKNARITGIILMLLGTFIFIWISRDKIEQSVMYVVQTYSQTVRKTSGTVLNLVGTDGQNMMTFHMACLLVLIIIIALLVAIETVYLHSMAAAIILISPFLAIFITFSVIPGINAFFFCVLYVFGTAARRKKEDSSTAGYMMLVMATVIYLCIILFIPQKGFERNEMFGSIYKKAEAVIDSFSGNLLGINAPGGINYGQLGKVNEVKFNNGELAKVTTISTGRNQYFKTFTGKDYERDQWTALGELEERVTEYAFSMMDASEQMQKYVTGFSGDAYYNHTKFFTYILKENSSQKQWTNYGFSIDEADYSRFQDIAEQKVWIEDVNLNYSGQGSSLLSPYTFGSYEREYRAKVRDSFTNMPDDIKSLIEELMGPVSAGSYADKVAYIERVKQFLQENYSYTVKPGKVPEGIDFLEYFLKESKKGYCTYFASAATMMFRYAGIPARYCEGYVLTDDKVIGGTAASMENARFTYDGKKAFVSENAYEVQLTDRNAHAWVEVYMNGYGWIPIEVTPGTGRNDSLADAQMQDGQQAVATPEESPEQQTADISEEETTQNAVETPQDQEVPTDQEPLQNDTGNAFPIYIGIGLWIMLSVIAVFMIIWLMITNRMNRIVRKRNNYMKRKDEKHADEQISCLYDYFVHLLKQMGYNKPAGMDYEQYVQMIEIADEQLQKCNVTQLMNLLLKARFYSCEEITDEEFAQIRSSLELLRNLVYARNKGAKKVKMKYIDAL